MSEEKNIEGSSSQSPGNKPQAASDKLAVKEEQKSIGNKQLANESPIEESELSTEISNQKSGISKSEIENMEVHKHPHHVTHKKRWGEYFLEFLMIFLAVFLGFLAENFREDIADRKKEKQFMASLIRDLKIDVNRTNMNINLRLKRIQYCDSLLFLLTSSLIKDSGAAIYYYARNIFVIRFPFTASNGAFEQLKNSGSIRLIRNPDLVDSLEKYYVNTRVIESNEQLESAQIDEYREAQSSIFQTKVFLSMFDSTLESTTIRRPLGKPSLLTYDAGLINKLCLKLHFWQRNAKGVYIFLINAKHLAENLISMIQKEYHLE